MTCKCKVTWLLLLSTILDPIESALYGMSIFSDSKLGLYFSRKDDLGNGNLTIELLTIEFELQV